MGLLPWSIGFSLLVAILCWSQFGRIHEEYMLHTAIVDVVTSSANTLYADMSQRSEDLYKKICPNEQKPERPKEPRHVRKSHQTPLTRKLHISALVSSGGGAEKQTQKLLFYRLLTILYGNQPLFHPEKNNVEKLHELFDELFEQILALEGKFSVKTPELLGNIEFTGLDKHKKEFIRFLLLKGGKGEVFSRRSCTLAPLGKFIEIRKRKQCMSVYLAPKPILLALFQNEETVHKVLETRREIRRLIVKATEEKKTGGIGIDGIREEAETMLRQFESCIPTDIDPNQIDFAISTTEPKA